MYAVVAVTNNDSCSCTFLGKCSAFISPTNSLFEIKSDLGGRTISPHGSCIAIFEVPSHDGHQWGVVAFVTKHTLMEQISTSFGQLFPNEKFEHGVESDWFPK
jgi:hypothetical protein